ncbi:MAG: tRNA pseudouridine(55) synthase TruB [Helicobacteraceae bacterium]|jgi:tRNA pseudouridine55 synthase|nr:tRNA pseudouridine(55) synthase TruB [Helicobacteraceae bacterium]
MNRLFVAYKPPFIGSNGFLSRLKRKYGVKSAGFSGILDPFAKGALIVAFGQYARLFNYLAKTPKVYRATLWLGARSESLDIERISRIDPTPRLTPRAIDETLSAFVGESEQYPPIFSAIKINGERSYRLARKGENVKMKARKINVYSLKPIAYAHPFLTFEAAASEGCYMRSLGRDIALSLGCAGALSSLERLKEGRFCFENEKPLNPLDFIDLQRNQYWGDGADLYCGKRLSVGSLAIQENGDYLIESEGFFVIINLFGGAVSYKLGRVAVSRSQTC